MTPIGQLQIVTEELFGSKGRSQISEWQALPHPRGGVRPEMLLRRDRSRRSSPK